MASMVTVISVISLEKDYRFIEIKNFKKIESCDYYYF